MNLENYFVFNPEDSRLEILVVVYFGVVDFNFRNTLLECDCFADSTVCPNKSVLIIESYSVFSSESYSVFSSEDQIC